jgi:hypothetical protein
MKRTLIAALLALSATTSFAANSQYINEAGQQDLHTPVADAGDKSAQEPNSPQVG